MNVKYLHLFGYKIPAKTFVQSEPDVPKREYSVRGPRFFAVVSFGSSPYSYHIPFSVELVHERKEQRQIRRQQKAWTSSNIFLLGEKS
jgi:hypothetical protein